MTILKKINVLPELRVTFYFWLLINALPHPRLPLIWLLKNINSNQDLHCKSWLKLVFLRSKIK